MKFIFINFEGKTTKLRIKVIKSQVNIKDEEFGHEVIKFSLIIRIICIIWYFIYRDQSY